MCAGGDVLAGNQVLTPLQHRDYCGQGRLKVTECRLNIVSSLNAWFPAAVLSVFPLLLISLPLAWEQQ